jgi:hypothetical protein
MDPREVHETALHLALLRTREGASNAMLYASAPTPGHAGFSFDDAPTEAGLHKMRPVFVCCYEHGEECQPSGPAVDCRLADQLHPDRRPSAPAFVSGVDLGMAARVGPAWFVREWLPGLRLARAIQ